MIRERIPDHDCLGNEHPVEQGLLARAAEARRSFRNLWKAERSKPAQWSFDRACHLKSRVNCPTGPAMLGSRVVLGFMFDADAVRRVALDEMERKLYAHRYEPGPAQDAVVDRLFRGILARIDPGRFKLVMQCVLHGPHDGIDVYSFCIWDVVADGVAVVNYEHGEVGATLTIWGIGPDGWNGNRSAVVRV